MSTRPLLDDTESLRARRRALRAEMNRVQHWRRLLRARIDLSVSAALIPDRLGLVASGALSDVTPPDHVIALCASANVGALATFSSTGGPSDRTAT